MQPISFAGVRARFANQCTGFWCGLHDFSLSGYYLWESLLVRYAWAAFIISAHCKHAIPMKWHNISTKNGHCGNGYGGKPKHPQDHVLPLRDHGEAQNCWNDYHDLGSAMQPSLWGPERLYQSHLNQNSFMQSSQDYYAELLLQAQPMFSSQEAAWVKTVAAILVIFTNIVNRLREAEFPTNTWYTFHFSTLQIHTLRPKALSLYSNQHMYQYCSPIPVIAVLFHNGIWFWCRNAHLALCVEFSPTLWKSSEQIAMCKQLLWLYRHPAMLCKDQILLLQLRIVWSHDNAWCLSTRVPLKYMIQAIQQLHWLVRLVLMPITSIPQLVSPQSCQVDRRLVIGACVWFSWCRGVFCPLHIFRCVPLPHKYEGYLADWLMFIGTLRFTTL